MALNNNDKRALLYASRRIERGDSRYICMALDSVARENYKLIAASERLQTYITKALAPHGTLGAWQAARGISHNDQAQRDDRVDWINWMLGIKAVDITITGVPK